ncbi:hypothetical protein PFISCL1PPCAC_28233, partial [Pristionchus fissidentatus]
LQTGLLCMDNFKWTEAVRRRLDLARSQMDEQTRDRFKDWIRNSDEPPAKRWQQYRERYITLDLEALLDRSEYSHGSVLDAFHYYLHRLLHCDEYVDEFDSSLLSLCQLLNVVYYTESTTTGETPVFLDEVIATICSTIAKFPRWVKVDLLGKLVCIGSPIYIAVRLFSELDSPSTPLPRSLLQSAGYTMDHEGSATEGYSVSTRIVGWGVNRLSNLGCNKGSSVDQTKMITLPKIKGSRVTIFSVGVNHSLFFTEDRKLFVTGRLKNWTGDSADQRIALNPVEVELPEEMKKKMQLPNVRCRSIYADGNSSDIVLVDDVEWTREGNLAAWRFSHIFAGCDGSGKWREPTFHPGIPETTDRMPHFFTTDRYFIRGSFELPLLEFRGSDKHRIDVEIYHDFRRGLHISEEGKSFVTQDLHICIGNVVHKPHSIRQAAFCDNGDVFVLLQVDRMTRNFVLVKGEIRQLSIDPGEWTKQANKRAKHSLMHYYLIAEQIPGAEHVTQFSVDRNGENLLFEIRDHPRYQQFKPVDSEIDWSYDDPEMCYGGATRNLKKLAHERSIENVTVEDDELVNLAPYIDDLCPRVFLTEKMIEDVKNKEMTTENQSSFRSGPFGKFLNTISAAAREADVSMTIANNNQRTLIPTPSMYFGASFANGSLPICVPRYCLPIANMSTETYEDYNTEICSELVKEYKNALFKRYPNGIRACLTGRSEPFLHITIRPEIDFGSFESEKKLRGLRALQVIYNNEYTFSIYENLWELHTPYFNRSAFHSSTEAPIECPFPEDVMRMCERAFIDPGSTENYSTNQLLNLLDVADYVCANLLTEDVVYRLLRNATRNDINSILGEITQALNSRASLVEVLSRFPHILFDWNVDVDHDILYEACELMQSRVGPIMRDWDKIPLPTCCNLSSFIIGSSNYALSIGPNDLPLSQFATMDDAVRDAYTITENNNLILISPTDRCNLLSTSTSSLSPDRVDIVNRCEKIAARFGEYAPQVSLSGPNESTIVNNLEVFLLNMKRTLKVPSPSQERVKKPSKRRSSRLVSQSAPKEEQELTGSIEFEQLPMDLDAHVAEPFEDDLPCSSGAIWDSRRAERIKQNSVSFAEILKEEEQTMLPKKTTKTVAKPIEGGKRSKFRPISFSEPGPSPKHVDRLHDWTQTTQKEVPAPKTNKPKALQEIMKEQSERKSGITRRRGPSVSGCQVEAAAIDAISTHYQDMVENHQLVIVESCQETVEAPQWSADGDLHLDQD